MKNNNDFVIWFKESWMNSGGLISSSIAGKLLNVTACRINQLIKEKKIKNYPYRSNKRILPMLSLKDVLELVETKKTRKAELESKSNTIQEIK